MSDNKKRIAVVCGKGTGGQLEAAIRKKLQSLGGEPVESSVSVRRADASGTGEDLLNAAKQKLTELSGKSITSAEEITSARIADDDVDTRERYIHDLIGDVESAMIASEFYPGMDRVDWHTTDDAIIILAKFIGGFEEITVPFADLQMDFKKMEEDVKTIMDGIFQSPDVGGPYEEQEEITSSFNLDEDEEEDPDWEYVKSKSVKDSDDFMTDYTMYRNKHDGTYIFMFGDNEIYLPDPLHADYTCETEEEAEEWFDSYTGFEDAEDGDFDFVDYDDDDEVYSAEQTTVQSAYDIVPAGNMFNHQMVFEITDELPVKVADGVKVHVWRGPGKQKDYYIQIGENMVAHAFMKLDTVVKYLTKNKLVVSSEIQSYGAEDEVTSSTAVDDEFEISEELNDSIVETCTTIMERARELLSDRDAVFTEADFDSREVGIADGVVYCLMELSEIDADLKVTWSLVTGNLVLQQSVEEYAQEVAGIYAEEYGCEGHDDDEVYSCDKTAVNGAFERGWYFGKEQADQYGDLICTQLSGKTVSKRKDTAEEPGGLIYEANQLGIDMWDLLGALEGLCYQGRAREIDDSTYRVA